MSLVTLRGSKQDPYDVVLADLRAQRERIDTAIAAIETLQGLKPQSIAPTEAVGPFTGLAIHEAAKLVLRERGAPLSNGEIMAGIREGGLVMNSADPINTVGAVLTRRAASAGDIVKVSRGVWGLVEWKEPSKADVVSSAAPEARQVPPPKVWITPGNPLPLGAPPRQGWSGAFPPRVSAAGEDEF